MPQEAVKTESYASVKENIGTKGYAGAAVADPPPAGTDAENKPDASTGDQPDGAETAGDSGTPHKQDKVEKRKQQIQADIDRQVARREAAKREADAEEARLAKLRQGNEQPRDTKPVEKPVETKKYDGFDPSDPEPKDTDFSDFQEWQDARSDWRARKEFRRLEKAKADQVAQEQTQKAQEEYQRSYKASVDDFESRGSEFAAEHEDYPELVTKFKEQKISSETEAFLLWGCQGKEGPEVLYGLMKEPEKLKEIEKLPSPMARFSALYALKYESQIKALEAQVAELRESGPVDPKRSKAPNPGTVLKGAGAGAPVTVDTAKNWNEFKRSFDKKEGLIK